MIKSFRFIAILILSILISGCSFVASRAIPLNDIKWHTWNRVEWIHVLDSESYGTETHT